MDLEGEISRLKQELNENESKLHRAGEIGNHLLSENEQLTEQLENLTQEWTSKIEILEQENYTLKHRLENKTQMESSYSDEIENLKQNLQQQKEELTLILEAEHASTVSSLKREIDTLQRSLDKATLTEKQMEEKNNRLEEMLKETQEQKMTMLNETCSEEITQLHSDLANLHAEKMSCAEELAESKAVVQQLRLECSNIRHQLESKDQEIEEKQCQATSYFNALEKSREEVQELKVELDLLKMESADHKAKGNSLFGELEDKRVEAEKKLISLKVQHDSLKSQYNMNKQHMHKIKMQLAAVLQMSCGRADKAHVDNLNSQLSKAREEIRELTQKLHKYEKLEQSQNDRMIAFHEAFGDKSDADYIKALLKSKDAKVEELQGQVKSKNFLYLAESDKLLEATRKLYETEQQLAKARGANMKLSLKIEDYKMKYEPEKNNDYKKIVKVRSERIPGFEKQAEEIQGELPLQEKSESQIDVNRTVVSEDTGKDIKKDTDGVQEGQITPSLQDQTEPEKFKFQSIHRKRVTISDSVDINEYTENQTPESMNYSSETGENAFTETGAPEVKKSRPRGRDKHHNVKKISKAQNECKTQ